MDGEKKSRDPPIRQKKKHFGIRGRKVFHVRIGGGGACGRKKQYNKRWRERYD